jgi:murein DD-endopeptidase MepM/ murein hydrolase activator NlpD
MAEDANPPRPEQFPSLNQTSSLPPSPQDHSISTRASALFRRHRLAILACSSVLAFGGAVGAFAVADDAPLPSSRRIVEELVAPDMHQQLDALAEREDVFVSEERIRSGDTLGSLLTRLGVADADAEKFLRTSPAARALQQLRPGRLVQARVDDEGGLQWLRYSHSTTDGKDFAAVQSGHALIVERRGDDLVAHDETLVNERRVELRSGEIRSSLFAATDAAGLPDGIATQIAEIFSGDIDFYRDLRRGDRFRIVYESYYQGGEFVRAGRILAVEFVNAGKSHAALWYGGTSSGNAPSDANLAGHYYGFDGRSLRRAFLRTPLEFTRISSGFGGRMHPISNVWRQHTGIDYAAPSGTPVRTTADGVVDFAGVKNGYGNVVIIKHQGVYSTLYGHLSQFASGLKRGQRIEQGRLIGYVGMTGWATGPHLHYEFRISDHATDPLTAALPEAPPIGRAEQASFRVAAGNFDRQIDLLRATEGIRQTASNGIAGNASQRVVAAPVPGG